MGNTSTSLHLLKPWPETRKLDRDVKAAYKLLGYEPARAQSDQQKRVVLAEHGGEGAFLSIHDSDNALIDNGELKQLAVALSKKLKTVAVFTSIYDSDRFEFIIFNKGKQVDAVVSEPDDHTAGLKVLKAGKRLTSWKEIFFAPASVRALLAPGALSDGAARIASIMERERAFEQRMQRIGAIEGPFAEGGLAACCEAAGLGLERVLTRDPGEHGDEAGAAVLTFAKLASVSDKTTLASTCTHEIKLATFISDDDWTAPKYFPAAWPFAEGQPAAIRWLVTSSRAGFSGLKLTVELPDAPPTLTGKLSVQALPFYNGQITPGNVIAFVELPSPALSDGAWSFGIEPFVIPDLDPQSRREIILVFVIELEGTGANAITFRPTLATTGAAVVELKLPPARLQLHQPRFVPLIADMSATGKAADVLKLNAATVFSMTALVEDETATLARVREWAETWLAALSPPDGTTLCIKTQKHMSPSFRVAKSDRIVSLTSATGDKQWPKLFDPKADYQSVMLRVMRDGDPFPVAGFSWQEALRDGSRSDKEQADAHIRDKLAPHLRPRDHAHPLVSETGSTVAVSAWMLNDPAIFEAMGVSPEALAGMFGGWMAGHDPIQAWITRAAWIPEFDVYESYHQTLYEATSSLDWFHSGLNGLLGQRAWACRRLRFVAPTMWLGRELTRMIDVDRLATVAEISRSGSATRIALRELRTLADLESVLEPILPTPGGV